MFKKIIALLSLTILPILTKGQDTTKIKEDSLKEFKIIGISNLNLEPITHSKINIIDYYFLQKEQDPFFIIDKATPSIYSQSDNGQENGYCYMRMRGLDQTRINYNLNGIPLNEMEDQGLYFSNIPGFSNYIGSIDVERGIGTSKYGNTSIAGSVDMETRSMSEQTTELYTLIKNSTNDQNTNIFYSSGINKSGIAIQLGGTYLNNNGFKDHSGDQGGSGFYSIGIFKKKNIFKIYGFSGIAHNQLAFYGVSKPIIDSYYTYNANLITDRDTFNQNMIALNWTSIRSDKYKFNTSVYFNNVKGDYNTSNVLFGVNSKQFGAMSNMVIENNNFITNIGINSNIYSRSHFGYDSSGYYGLLNNNIRYTNTGNKEDIILYLKGLYNKSLYSLFYDLQLRNVWFITTNSNQYTWTFFNPKIGFKTNTDNNNIYLNVGMTQREPTRTDMIQNIIQSDSIYGANTDNTKFFNDSIKLKPEVVYDIEVGYKYHISDLDINFNAYYMTIKNEYVATGVIDQYSGFMVKQVVSQTLRDGIECSIKLKINHFNLFFNSQLQHSDILINNTISKIPFAPDFIGSFGASYKIKFIDFGIVEQSVSSMIMSLDQQNYSSTPYSIFNGFIDFKYRNAIIGFKLNNILNNKYYIPAGISVSPTYYVGQLMNYSLSLKIKF